MKNDKKKKEWNGKRKEKNEEKIAKQNQRGEYMQMNINEI